MWHARTGESQESWSQGQGGQPGASGPGEYGAGVRGGRDTAGNCPAVTVVSLPVERVDGLAEESDGSRREASELDAAVQSDRTLITVMEASARGVSQQRFPSFVTVVQQLWESDPPEVWEAARRRAVAGLGAGPAGADLGRARGRQREVCRGADGTVTVHP